jgi:hypothetical protein
MERKCWIEPKHVETLQSLLSDGDPVAERYSREFSRMVFEAGGLTALLLRQQAMRQLCIDLAGFDAFDVN